MDNKFVLSQSFNEIVFEKRNKKYGAYDIRRKYSRYAMVAGACAILFFTCGSLTWAYVERPEDLHDWRVIEIDETPPMPGVKPIEPLKPVEPVKPVEPKVSAAELGPKSQALTSIIEIVETDSVPPGNLEAGRDPKGVVGGTSVGAVDSSKGNCIDCIVKVDTTVRLVVWSNHPPTCEGLDAYLQKNIRYPQLCREQGIEGTVHVQFIVDTKGNYRDVQVVKGANPAMNAEALRVMSTMPKWEPAKDDNGVLVEYVMHKPIKFELAK
jgi:protein TonB